MNRKVNITTITIMLVVLIIISIPLCIFFGTVSIPPNETIKIVASKFSLMELPEAIKMGRVHIVWNLRLPRVLLAIAVGGGLSVCGVAIQALTRSPLANPYILGVSSGASMTATIVILLGLNLFGTYSLAISAFIGAFLALILVYSISVVRGRTSSTRLLLSGIAVSMVLLAITNFIVMLAPRSESIRTAMFWMMGGLGYARWDTIGLPLLVSIIGAILIFTLSRTLNSLALGDETAVVLGINVDKTRKRLLLIVSVIVGTLVAISGAIGFIGLIIPHITRFKLGSNHKIVTPISFLLGALFLMWMDVFARTLLSPQEIPIGILTSLCGGPFFIYLLRNQSGEKEG